MSSAPASQQQLSCLFHFTENAAEKEPSAACSWQPAERRKFVLRVSLQEVSVIRTHPLGPNTGQTDGHTALKPRQPKTFVFQNRQTDIHGHFAQWLVLHSSLFLCTTTTTNTSEALWGGPESVSVLSGIVQTWTTKTQRALKWPKLRSRQSLSAELIRNEPGDTLLTRFPRTFPRNNEVVWMWASDEGSDSFVLFVCLDAELISWNLLYLQIYDTLWWASISCHSRLCQNERADSLRRDERPPPSPRALSGHAHILEHWWWAIVGTVARQHGAPSSGTTSLSVFLPLSLW